MDDEDKYVFTNDLLKYQREESVVYHKTPTKQIRIKLNGGYEVWEIKEDETVKRATPISSKAVQLYNNLP